MQQDKKILNIFIIYRFIWGSEMQRYLLYNSFFLLMLSFLFIHSALGSNLPSLYSLSFYSENDIEKIVADCTPTEPDKMKCNFQSFYLYVPIEMSDSEYDSELTKLYTKIETEAKNKTFEKYKSEINEWCNKSNNNFDEFIKISKEKYLPISTEKIEKYQKDFSKICKTEIKSKEKATLVFRESVLIFTNFFSEFEGTCCEVDVNPWEMEFNKVSDDIWVNSPHPYGLCNVVILYEFYRNKEDGIWNYYETKLSYSDEHEVCKGIKNELNKKKKWSEKGDRVHKLLCPCINLSDVNMSTEIFKYKLYIEELKKITPSEKVFPKKK
jgi:hypothetical protein